MGAVPLLPCLAYDLPSVEVAINHCYIAEDVKVYAEHVLFAIGRITEYGLEIVVTRQTVFEIILGSYWSVNEHIIIEIDKMFGQFFQSAKI